MQDINDNQLNVRISINDCSISNEKYIEYKNVQEKYIHQRNSHLMICIQI